MRRGRDIARRPDMIQPTPLVRCTPILGPVGPPGIEQPIGNIRTRHVHPATGLLRSGQMLHLDRRVAHDLQQLLVAPDVILAGGNVQVAHQDRPLGWFGQKPVAHVCEVIQLLAKLLVFLAVRHIPACGDVKVVDSHSILKPPGNMASMAERREILRTRLHHRNARQDRHTVIPLVAARHHVGIAKRLKPRAWDLVHRAFTLLQAQHIGRLFFQQLQHNRFAQADGIDVPGGKGKGHGAGSDTKMARP
mmetsp:Transcript_124/g.387  ORF Transcript_124/g.387 Transcript_124/m.387 type:complete len:248 (+) Transcript_124:399-1142(+)